ncbi:hypothetical protein AB3R30_05805 [Leptolyngbyaceae cyanobacterium UHCC 1019]
MKGGAYKAVREANQGGEVHHMPAASASRLRVEEGPAIWMETLDHRQTASWGRSRSAIDYRKRQQALIQQGKFLEALQMDIEDIRSKFDSKYDQAIQEMLEYVETIRDRLNPD